MVVKTYIGIPCYAESERLHETVNALRRSTRGTFQLDVQVEQQSVVKNKNAILQRAKASDAEYVAFCDDDAEPEVAWDLNLVRGMQEVEGKIGRRIGQTTPLLVLPDGSIFALWFNAVLCEPERRGWVESVGHYIPDDPKYARFIVSAAVCGTVTMFRREVLEAVNWRFDDRFPRSQWEDIDQSLMCRAHGFEVLYNGHVRAVHYIKGTAPRASDENYRLLLEKWGRSSELSRAIGCDPVSLRVADREINGGGRMADLAYLLKQLARNPLHRVREGVRVVRKSGVAGLIAKMRQREANGID